MSRVAPVDFEKLTPEQQRVYKDIAGPRLVFGGPWTVWIRQPQIAEVLNKVGDVLRVNGKLEKRLQELLTLIVAREWNCDYMWYVHEGDAEKKGLSKEVIQAIKNRQVPRFTKDDEQVVYDLITELYRNKAVSQQTYDRALKTFGEDLLIELVTNAGRYTQSAVVVNAFEVAAPGDAHPMTKG
jgi:4-carboxymuconolactone decarboxylase